MFFCPKDTPYPSLTNHALQSDYERETIPSDRRDRPVRLFAPLTERIFRIAGLKPLITPCSLDPLQNNGHFSHAKAERELGCHPREFNLSFRDMLEEKGM